LAELTLALRAEPAKSDFLHPVCDGAQQQLTAEMRRGVGFVERAPLLAKLGKAVLGRRASASRHALASGSARLMSARRSGGRGRVPPSPKRG